MDNKPKDAGKPVDFNPFGAHEIEKTAPATESQLEIWLSCQFGGDDANRSYNESVSLEFSGTLDAAALDRALQTVIDRHEALRSSFSGDGRSVVIYTSLPTDLVYRDLSGEDHVAQKQEIDAFLVAVANTAFDLTEGPLFRFWLFKLSETEHYFSITIHHSICDGWSLGVLLQELGVVYSALAQGSAPNLPPAPSFAQFAVSQLQFRDSAEYRAVESYWTKQYADVPVLDMPVDFPRPSSRTYKSRRDDYQLDRVLVSAVKEMGARAGASLVTTLVAAFEVFLSRYTGQEEIILGLPAAAQPVTGNPGLIAHCVNLLPLRSKPADDKSFADFLQLQREYLADAYENQLLTFGSLLKTIHIPRDRSRIPLVPVVLNVDMGLDKDVAFHGLSFKLVYNARQYETFELFVNLAGSEDELTLQWSYNTQLFSAETVEKMMSSFSRLLQEVVSDPSIVIGDIQLGRSHITHGASSQSQGEAGDFPLDRPAHVVISEVAERYPDRIALHHNERSMTYRDLNDRVRQMALVLRENNISRGDIVAVGMYRSPEMVTIMLAVLSVGAAYLPVDPAVPAERRSYMLDDSRAKLLITNRTFRNTYDTGLKVLLLEEIWPRLAAYPSAPFPVAVSPNDLAYILYTSGSTGKPKAVQIEHHSLVNIIHSVMRFPGFDMSDRLLGVTVFSFDISGVDVYLPLFSGATLYMTSVETARDGSLLLDMIRAVKPTFMQATPATWRMLLDAGWNTNLPIRKIASSGEALPRDLAERLLERCDELYNFYGPTETTIWSTGKRVLQSDPVITIGKPVHNTQVYILDEKGGLLPDGMSGEIHIGGEGVARGYLNRDDLNAQKFIDDPFRGAPNARLYRTGDLGRFLPNGEIEYLGRADQQVKVRGYRIEPGEIEFVLNQQPDIRQSVVLAIEDQFGDMRLVTYVVPTEEISDEDRRDYINLWKEQLIERLPAYMVPNDYIFVESIPLTLSGKVDRNALPKPSFNHGVQPRYVAPLTDVEKIVADIWAEVLGVEQVGIYDDFFELGGHSLMAVRMMTKLEKETGRRLPLAILFEHPTVESLSYALKMDAKFITWNSLVPLKPGGKKTTLYIVHGGGLNVLLFNTLARNMDPDQPVYALQAKGLNGIDEPLDRMEDIAAHYINEILNHNPNGPYALAGYSFGGTIAFEMAKQMRAMGKEIRVLALFDTYADKTDKYDSSLKKALNRVRLLIMKVLFTFVLLAEDFVGTIKYKTMSIRMKLVRLWWKLRKSDRKDDQIGFFGYVNKIDEKNMEAAYNYVITPYEGSVDLFKAKKRTFYMDDFTYMGWREFALGGVRVHDIPGEHNYIFAPPNDKYFASILQKCLDDADAEFEAKKKPEITR